MTVAELLAAGAAALTAREGMREPHREARFLLARLLDRTEAWLVAHPEAVVDAQAEHRFHAALARRAAGEPAHYVIGTCPFWGRDFTVTPAVLIPRPETELVVERALALSLPAHPLVVDVGTGSGCLAITLALELPVARVLATDRSLAALAVARANALRLGADLGLVAGHLADHLASPFDLVVANLPYVPSGELPTLMPEVREFEPRQALDGGSDGATWLRALVCDLPRLLAPGGRALLELGPGQADRLADEAARGGLVELDRGLDAGGVERLLVLSRPTVA